MSISFVVGLQYLQVLFYQAPEEPNSFKTNTRKNIAPAVRNKRADFIANVVCLRHANSLLKYLYKYFAPPEQCMNKFFET